MERTITDCPAPYCFRACLWSQCCILLLATLEWGQWGDRWQQMESQKCPSRYKDLAIRNFLLGIRASWQLNLWTFLSVYPCLPVSSCQCPCLLVGHTHTTYWVYNKSYWVERSPTCSAQFQTWLCASLHWAFEMKTLGISCQRSRLMTLSSSKENECLKKANLSLPSASLMCTK